MRKHVAQAPLEHLAGRPYPENHRSSTGYHHFAGRMRDAIALREQSLATRERVLGPDHWTP